MKTIQHAWSLICEKSIIDAETNNLNLINIIEKFSINVPMEEKIQAEKNGFSNLSFRIPYEIVTLYRVNNIEKEKNLTHKTTLLNSQNKVIGENINKTKIKKNIKNFRVRNRMRELIVNESGTYSINVFAKEGNQKDFTLCATIPFDVQVNYNQAPEKPKKNSRREQEIGHKSLSIFEAKLLIC